MNEQAIWKLVEEGGVSALTIERLADATGQSPLDLHRLYPDPAFMIVALAEELHQKAMETLPDSELSPFDRLTDLVMTHFDISLPYRESIRRLWEDLVTTPSALLILRPHLMKIVSHILQAVGMDERDAWAPFRVRAYFALFIYVFYTWLYDESTQQEQTLACLDNGLKKLGDLPW